MTFSKDCGADWVISRKFLHLFCMLGSAASDKASFKTDSSNGVSRCDKVSRIASCKMVPSNFSFLLREYISQKSFVRPERACQTIIASNFSAMTLSNEYVKTDTWGWSGKMGL